MAYVWIIAAATILLILVRPKGWPEAIWACAGAILFMVNGAVSVSQSLGAVARGREVYLFLAGMMLLAELARQEGVFEWVAGRAVQAARGRPARLLLLVYCAGALVTVFLSNDATAVVLTPAVYAAVRRANTVALPHLLACAFVANAASFVLPISNPANLVVYGQHLPPLMKWLAVFAAPSATAIIATWAVLRFVSRRELRGEIQTGETAPALSPGGKRASWAIAAACVILIVSSALGRDLGMPIFVAGLAAVLASSRRGEAIRGVSWTVLPLVAGLFVMVEALDRAGATGLAQGFLRWAASLPHTMGALAAAFGSGLFCNLANNLPAGLLAGTALGAATVPEHIRNAVLIGVDLGPNLSVTGSLATILWLIALRREGENISGWQFLKAGALVMPPALALAAILLFNMGI